MSLRDIVREKSEARYFAMDTLKTMIDWIKTANPQAYLFADIKATKTAGEEPIIRIEDMRSRMTDWVQRSGDLIEKGWVLPELLLNDAIKVLKDAQSQTTSPNK